MRFSYIPQVNKIYFWDGKFTQNSANDGTMSANSKTLTSATAAFTANSVG